VSASVDWDRLAEYAAGLLDGTPDAEQVAHLIETDDEWARGYQELSAADRLVAADLAALGSVPEPMPADVLAGIEAAFAAEERDATRTVVPLDARRRRRRWTVAGGIAAGVVALAFVGPQILGSTVGRGFNATDSGAGLSAEAPAAAPGAPEESGLIITTSGRNYLRETLGQRERINGLDISSTSGAPPNLPDLAEKEPPVGMPAELRRLGAADARRECLDALIRRYGGRAVSVDYARLDSQPAVVVTLADANNQPTRIVAAGPDCGLGGDAHVLHDAPTG
jgi:hypothetical protein